VRVRARRGSDSASRTNRPVGLAIADWDVRSYRPRSGGADLHRPRRTSRGEGRGAQNQQSVARARNDRVGASLVVAELDGRGCFVERFDDRADLTAYARTTADRRKAGRPVAQFDAQIAAIAYSRNANPATRNVGDLADCGVRLVNPWRAASE
jgi:predicted nucleic acid-binding protein